jgi:hypothetical protein
LYCPSGVQSSITESSKTNNLGGGFEIISRLIEQASQFDVLFMGKQLSHWSNPMDMALWVSGSGLGHHGRATRAAARLRHSEPVDPERHRPGRQQNQ